MDETQKEPPLPFPEFSGDLPLLPVRMLNEFQYCPAWLIWNGCRASGPESADTVEGRAVHRRVDRPSGELPPAAEVDSQTSIRARSITLSSNRLGLIAKMDLIEAG